MFHVNLLSRKDTDQFTPLFEIIYVIELSFILCAYIAASALIYSAIRLRIISAMLVVAGHLTARVMVMKHQYYGTSKRVITGPLVFGSVMREIFLGYMTSLVAILALDRWVATTAWAWYENSESSTLLFFVFQESILFSISLAVAFLVVNEHITDMQSMYYFAVIIAIGAVCFSLVFRHNQRVMREMKRGAVINEYSVARTYQIRENILLLTAFSNVARPLVIVCLPPFLFYPIFTNLPANTGLDGLRFFSASMYDLWLSIASFVVISCLPYYWPDLQQPLRGEATLRKFTTTINDKSAETGDTYFTLLFNDLGR